MQQVVQTLARFGEDAWCEGLTVDRAGNIYAAMRENEGKPTHVLQIKHGTNELVQLPVRLHERVYTISISPSGQELYESTATDRILVHRAPWADIAGEVLSTVHDNCSFEFCDGDRCVLLLVHCPNTLAEIASPPPTGSTSGLRDPRCSTSAPTKLTTWIMTRFRMAPPLRSCQGQMGSQ